MTSIQNTAVGFWERHHLLRVENRPKTNILVVFHGELEPLEKPGARLVLGRVGGVLKGER